MLNQQFSFQESRMIVDQAKFGGGRGCPVRTDQGKDELERL